MDQTNSPGTPAVSQQIKETLYRGWLETAPDAVVIVNAAGRMAFVNDQTEKLFGYRRAELLNQPVEMLLPAVLHQTHVHHRTNYIADPHTRPMGAGLDLIGARKDGSSFPVEISLSPAGSEHEQFVTAIIRDITERKLAEAKIAQHKLTEAVQAQRVQRLALQRDVHAALAEHDHLREKLQGCVVTIVQHLNAAFARIWTLNEAGDVLELQASAGLYTHLDGAHARVPVGQFKIGLIAAERQPHLTNDVQHDPRVGNREWAKREGMVAFAGYPLLSGDRLVGVVAMFACTTLTEAALDALAAVADTIAQGIERQRTRQSLKETEARLIEQAALLNQTQEAIVTCDLAGCVTFWNRGAERIYGWTAEEVMGRNLHAELYGSDSAAVEQAQQALQQIGEWAGELRQFTKAGQEIIIEGRWVLLRDAAGAPASYLIVNHDVTEKKKIEAQYLRAQRMESIGALVGGIAHDLNNVLAPILMAANMLQIKITDLSLHPLLNVVQGNVERGAEMIRQVLAFARGTTGEHLPLQPKHIIKELIGVLHDTFPKSIEISFDFPAEPAVIAADATQLFQVLMNLCVNARDAMPGGGKLTITTEERYVDETYARMQPDAKPGRYVVITITDTGQGIAPESLPRIFDPFFTTKEEGKGTGLGLASVASIIKSHDGFINVYSEVGKGTQFRLHLPTIIAPETQDDNATQAPLPIGHGELILVVDDEAAIREITRNALEAYGYRVLIAGDGTEAIAVYAQHVTEIQAVLTDMAMPYLDGAATTTALLKINPQVRIISCSGLHSEDRSEALPVPGALLRLTKPFTAHQLLHAVAAVLADT